MIHPTAVIYPNVIIGKNVYIGPNCVIGGPSGNKKTWISQGEGVIIEDNVVIQSLVTIESGTLSETRIQRNCFIMDKTYIGHDSWIEQGVTISPLVKIAGHVLIKEYSNLGMGVSVHQFCRVASRCMIGMNSTVTKTSRIKDNCVYVGSPVRYLRKNEK